ncbi:MAG: hypothetical protein ACOCXP_03645 [Candidatus Dojkabacteria bacterium]
MVKPTIKLDRKLSKVKVGAHDISSPQVFQYFSALKADEYTQMYKKALQIGVLALMEERIAAFLAKTESELDLELENLKNIYELNEQIFFKTTIKGKQAEEIICNYLKDYVSNNSWSDNISATGDHKGKEPQNKAGDILAELESGKKIAIEVKFDKSYSLGELSNHKSRGKQKSNTAWSELLESKYNREAKTAIIVFDKQIVNSKLIKRVENVSYFPGVGFVVIVDSRSNDFTNLAIAYKQARVLISSEKYSQVDENILSLLLSRVISEIKAIAQIEKLVNRNIKNNQRILDDIRQNLVNMKFNQEYLEKYLETGKLDGKELLEYYHAEKRET